MIGKSQFHLLLDILSGSCGKGAISPRLSEIFGLTQVSCHNYPNAGHTAVIDGVKFISKAIPTPMLRQRVHGKAMTGFISPGSGFAPLQILREWLFCDRPNLIIHDRATLVLPEHARRERSGAESTKHLASTMQGCGAAMADKLMRLPGVKLAKDLPEEMGRAVFDHNKSGEGMIPDAYVEAFFDSITIADGQMFRDAVFAALHAKGVLHEGSQGYSLSIDHGLDYPKVTSRNCDTGQALSYMGVPPQRVGEVWGVLRAGHSIRVGNVVEDGKTLGDSGDGYPDTKQMTWAELGERAGMPQSEIDALSTRELTTVTGRLRKVFTESRLGIADAVRTCGITGLIVNFLQYVNWADAGKTKLEDISPQSRAYIAGLEDTHQIPVVMLGTGADHSEYIWCKN